MSCHEQCHACHGSRPDQPAETTPQFAGNPVIAGFSVPATQPQLAGVARVANPRGTFRVALSVATWQFAGNAVIVPFSVPRGIVAFSVAWHRHPYRGASATAAWQKKRRKRR